MAASAGSAPKASPARFRGLLLRVVSAVVLGPLLLAAVWYGFPWIDLVAALCAPVMIGEWFRLTRGRPLAFVLAVVYSIAALLALLWLRHQPAYGRETVIWILACVWATDIGAYFIGSFAGGARLAPSISPGKTWSGLVGGMCFSAVVSAVCGLVFAAGETLMLAATGIGIAVVAQGGDLLESAAKRRAGVKDSGNLIPGHGGVLDRIDGLIAALVFIAAIRLATTGDWPWA
jgi:phosphatidate cytidylyltransferase